MFIPWQQVRSLRDWFMPLDGCPRCGYPFEREPGYFLLSIFAINYGVAAILGLVIYLVLDFWARLPIWASSDPDDSSNTGFQPLVCSSFEGPVPRVRPLFRSAPGRG